jgi:hypothetical protein
MDIGERKMESIDHTFKQARTDFNFICSKLSYKDEELPIVCETVRSGLSVPWYYLNSYSRNRIITNGLFNAAILWISVCHHRSSSR